MRVAWGVVVVLLTGPTWVGQVVNAVAPGPAARFGLTEAEADVEPLFWVDTRAEAAWDAWTLWVLPVAGVLMVADHDWWTYFGLVGGGSYLYFAGRGVVARLRMRRDGFRIGSDRDVRVGIAALAVWGLVAAGTIAAAIGSLESVG
ncbi:MAG: hypothetical protein HKN26_14230 [Acidimicrobiales bacterium]|nr:hypothetical protein [Acidimicrobiales bacterium]